MFPCSVHHCRRLCYSSHHDLFQSANIGCFRRLCLHHGMDLMKLIIYYMHSVIQFRHLEKFSIARQGYLLVGYFQLSTENYDIDWTLPHCVLVLRMTGLALDVLDGEASEKVPSAALKELPSLVEILGFSYFYGGVTVGPQFSFSIYSSFVNGNLMKSTKGRFLAGLKNLGLGVFYIGIVAYSLGFFNTARLFEKEWQEVGGLHACP